MVTMTKELTEKVYNLQKDFLELHNLFDINMVANQSRSTEELLSKIAVLIKSSLELKTVRFFLNSNNIFQTKNIITFDDMEFEFNGDNAPFLQKKNANLIKVTSDDGKIIYKAFWNTYKLNELNSEYLKVFYDNDVPFCVCSLSEKENGEKFTEENFKYLAQIFGCVEPVLAKFIKNKEQEDRIAELNKTINNLSILYNISQAVNFIDDLKRLISVILDKALEAVNAEKGSLMLYDSSDNTLQVKVVYGLKDKKHEDDINNGLVECQKMSPDSGIAGKVFSEKKSIITNLGGNDPRFNQFSTGDNSVSSLICVPLIAKGECIGIINITNKKNGKLFNKKDLEFIEALANQAAIAVDNAQLYELATKDGLTKLYIHRHFYFLLESEMKRVERYHHVLSLLMLDIDDFKAINDKYGHLVGDMVLKEIAATIQKTIRHVDIAARYGGEEFTIILPETAIYNSVIIAERLRQRIRDIKIRVDNEEISPSVSIGIAEYPNSSNNIKDLINWADKALYMSKNNGKNCIHMYFNEKFERYNPNEIKE